MGGVGNAINSDPSYTYTTHYATALSPPQLKHPTSHHTINSPSIVLSTPVPHKRKASLPIYSPASKRAALEMAQKLPADLGEYIARDVKLLQQLGWNGLVKQRRSTSDFASLNNVHHPAKRLLSFYKHRGAPVKFATPPWTRRQVKRALNRGPHRSCFDHLDFLKEEFFDMIGKGQWFVLPAQAMKDLPGLRLSPPVVIPQRYRRSRWICNYSWWGFNDDTLLHGVWSCP